MERFLDEMVRRGDKQFANLQELQRKLATIDVENATEEELMDVIEFCKEAEQSAQKELQWARDVSEKLNETQRGKPS